MSHDFALVRAVAERSITFRVLSSAVSTVQAAWRSSITGRRLSWLRRGLDSASAPDRVRWCATVIAVAAAVHLVLRSFMPATVAPAMPAAFFLALAAGGAVIEWNAEMFHRAWGHSRLARLLR